MFDIISREDICTLLDVGVAVSSVCYLRPWTFVVEDTEGRLVALYDSAELGKYNVSQVINVCVTDSHLPWKSNGWLFDIGVCAQNIMLECVELGLMAVCIGGFDAVHLIETFAIPEGICPV